MALFFLSLWFYIQLVIIKKNQKGVWAGRALSIVKFENQKAAQNLKRPALLRCSNIPFDKFNKNQDALRSNNKTN
jgi:hypothetical protein